MRKAAQRSVKEKVERDGIYDILKKGGIRGRRATDTRGKPLRSVGNIGLQRGGRAVLTSRDGLYGLSLRALEDVQPLLTHDSIAEAMGDIERGADLQSVSRRLQHIDTSTVKGVVKAWHDEWKVPPPVAYSEEAPLTGDALKRVSQRAADFIAVPVMCVSAWGECFSTAEWVGRTFPNGGELQQEFLRVPQALLPSPLPRLATYNMLVAPKDEWMDPVELGHSLASQQVAPLAIICISCTPELTVVMDALPRRKAGDWAGAIAKYGTPETHSYRAVLGSEPEADVHKLGYLRPDSKEDDDVSCNAATLILAVDKTLLQPQQQQQAAAAVPSSEGGLFAPLSGPMVNLVYPASLLQKAIRRGATLCGQEPITDSLRQLTGGGEHHLAELQHQRVTGTRMALWKVFISALEDVSPYHARDASCLSIPQLVGLTFLAHVEMRFSLTPELHRRLAVTALRLQATERSSSLWPWKGWKWRKSTTLEKALRIEPTSNGKIAEVRNAIRASLLGLPLSRGERVILMKYLGGLDDNGVWARAVPALMPCVAEARLAGSGPYDLEADTERDMSQHNHFAQLSALDPQIKPTLLLLLQASLPHVPKDAMQHSLRALAEATWTLSSGVNVRALKQKLSGAAQETYRFLSFVSDAPGAATEVTPEQLGLYKEEGPNETDRVAATWRTVREGQRLTRHECRLLDTIQQLQQRLLSMMQGLQPPAPLPLEPIVADPNAEGTTFRGRRPTLLEGRTAFLQLFGARENVSAQSSEGKAVACTVTVAGVADDPLLVQRVAGSDSGDQTGRGGLKDKTLQANAETKVLAKLAKGIKVVPPLPPVGFAWRWDVEAEAGRQAAVDAVGVKVAAEHSAEGVRVLRYYVEGEEVDPFNAAHLLVECNEPARRLALPQRLSELVSAALYTPGNEHPNPTLMFEELHRFAEHFRASNLSRNDVYEWQHIAEHSQLPKAVWRDLAIKLATREGSTVDVSKCSRDGTKTGAALQQLTEGVLLRVLYTLHALYPMALTRSGELRFKLDQKGAQYVHLQRTISLLAFGSYDDGEGFHTAMQEADDDESLFSFEDEAEAADATTEEVPEVTTNLWSHQSEAVQRVLEGISVGKRGFADASAVGAGKTLSAVACCAEVAKWMRERRLRRHGFLVLVPNTDLIGEWVQQALLHTRGLHVVAQQQTGYLISRGVSNAGKPPTAHPSTKRGAKVGKVDANTLVISTLGRLRDKPFVGQPGWDLVVIDECLSVQNDSALQTAEAWRAVSASRCGVLMLSATLFRSRMSKLFYMIRMLRSALPRTEAYLPALLAEHIICYLPERVRSWRLHFVPVALPEQTMNVYQARLSAAARAQKDARLVYGELKQVLRELWEPKDLMDAAREECRRLKEEGRHVLLFANSERELDGLKAAVPGTRTWNAGTASAPKDSGPLAVTTQRGAYGLNLQKEANCIVCRPQPGDLIEQMKGRVDRPGQETKELVLCVLYAQNTIEEVEAANIRLCGAFFRQYIDPLSRLFHERAIEASLSAPKRVVPRRGAQGGKAKDEDHITGSLADAFHQQLGSDGVEVTAPAEAEEPTSSTATTSTEGSAPSPKRARTTSTRSGSQSSASPSTAAPRRLTKEQREAEKKRIADEKAAQKQREEEEEAQLPAVPTRITNESAVRALEWLTQRDSKLATVIAAVGPPTDMVSELGNDPALKSLVRSIIFQQISMKAASSIMAKLMATLGGEVTLEALQGADDNTLRSAGLSARKVSYIRNVCEKFASGDLSDEKLSEMSDKDVLAALCSIKGMGEWSSHMFMMFKLGRHDVLPVGDLAVRQAFQKLYGLSPHDSRSETQVQYLPSPDELHAIAKCWRPYRTIGTWYMWHVVETKEAVYTYGS